MPKIPIEIPEGDLLERQIESVENRIHDERVRITISQRVAMTDDPATVFVAHEDAFAESRARLLKRLAGKGDA